MGTRILSLLGAVLIIFGVINSSAAKAQAQSFTISGRVSEPPSGTGVGISGVTLTMTLNSSTQTTTQTDSGGNFSFPNIPAGSNVDVTPTKPNFTFNPSSQGRFNVQSDQTIFFTGAPAASSTVQFAAATSAVTESNVSLTITVTRTGDTTGAATVNYATSDTVTANCNVVSGAASSRCDYSTTVGTLSFAGGETSKSISIPIIDDVHVEGSETFTATLSNASGATLGSPSVATITVNESETGGANPIDQANFFVRQHYIDFLNREPDAGGLAFWTNEITSCGSDAQCIDLKRTNVSAAFFLSIEFQETGYLTYRMYKAAFGDATSPGVAGTVPVIRLLEFLPDTQRMGQGVVVGVGNWQQQLEDNKNAYAAEFVARQRFLTAFPLSLTPAQFVDQLNTNAGGALSQSERDNLVNSLAGGTMTRAQVLRAVAEDQTLKDAEFRRAFVLMQYFGYLRRNPDDSPDTNFGGWKFWLNKLNEFNGNFVNAQMVKAFLDSIEYRNRFGP